jgi:hypothetical protein
MAMGTGLFGQGLITVGALHVRAPVTSFQWFAGIVENHSSDDLLTTMLRRKSRSHQRVDHTKPKDRGLSIAIPAGTGLECSRGRLLHAGSAGDGGDFFVDKGHHPAYKWDSSAH